MERDILIIGDKAVKELLDPDEAKKIILKTYFLHDEGKTVLPHSIFLRPDSKNRIIGLPANVGGDVNVSGIKWVSSYPDNILHGIPRASSVIILNDVQTGYQLCCINGTYINLFRTTCSAFLVAEWLCRERTLKTLGIIGAGAISGCFIDCLLHFNSIAVNETVVYDKNVEQAEKFIHEKSCGNMRLATNVEELITSCDMILFATTAASPYISDITLFKHNPLVLNLSLRDLAADIILCSNNIVDDVDHVNREKTSIHLAFGQSGALDFVNGSIANVLKGKTLFDRNKPIILSPFGLGILDVAVGKFIYDRAIQLNKGILINNF